jgi:transposase-like protein
LPASASVPYLNNVLEQDHRAIKRRVSASQHFRSFWGACRSNCTAVTKVWSATKAIAAI